MARPAVLEAPSSSPPEARLDNRTRLIRFALAAAAVGLWMALGFAFGLDVNAYLILGVPLTIAFQLLIARRPLLELWMILSPRPRGEGKGEGSFGATPAWRVDRWLIAIFLALCVVPTTVLVNATQRQNWTIVVYALLAFLGAFGAAYALRHANRETLRHARDCLLYGGAIGIGLLLVSVAARGGVTDLPEPVPFGSVLVFFRSLLLYTAVSFVMEEVFFRGALDSYVQDGRGERDQLSAVYVSALWGIWHLPITFATSGLIGIPSLLGVHIALGLPLSLWFRRSRNLAVPALTHAFVNGVRNALALA